MNLKRRSHWPGRPKIVLLAIGTGMLVLFLAIAVASATPTGNPLAAACPHGPVFAEFAAPDGAGVVSHFPSMAKVGELTLASGPLYGGPLYVVALKGPVTDIQTYVPRQPGAAEPVYNNVVCVVTSSGDSWDYFNVDFSTYQP